MDGATIIDVDEVGFGRFRDACRLFHSVLTPPEQLDTDRPFVLEDVQLLQPFRRLADQPFAADELGVHQVRTMFLAQRPERRIAHILHGREQERELRQFDGADTGHGKGPPTADKRAKVGGVRNECLRMACFAIFAAHLERWPSGLRRTPGKCVYSKG